MPTTPTKPQILAARATMAAAVAAHTVPPFSKTDLTIATAYVAYINSLTPSPTVQLITTTIHSVKKL